MQIKMGDKIRELRRRNGCTQEILAAAIGVTSQAVSRWEANGGYPDMEILPVIANYFGVTIDVLFGYCDDREERVKSVVDEINDMNFRNNGVDINIDECIALAREAMLEFPGDERIMLCLASVLYNAGYVRYGEYHLTDEEGYDIYDTERHRGYAEWREAILLYEKLLETIEEGELRHRAVRELTQLYLNTGEHARAIALIETLPDLYGTREFLRINACDGKKRAEAYGQALLRTVRASAELMIGSVISNEEHMTPSEKADAVRSAIGIFDHVCTDGNYGPHNAYIARMYTLLSLYLWLDGKRDDAFEALDRSLAHFRLFELCCGGEDAFWTAPLIRAVKMGKPQAVPNSDYPHTDAKSLAEDWPWWSVSEDSLVRSEIQSDPRWKTWVERLKA